MEYDHVAILLTENCNARCEMCCDNRGRSCGHTLTIEELDIILSQVKNYSFAKTVGITGGEPMLYPELCEYIMNYDYGRKMQFTIKTNGFWGNDKEKVKCFLEKNADKIVNISFSYDEFHKKFIDIRSIKNIIELAMNYKIATDVVGCFLANGMQPGDILNEFGKHAYMTEFFYQPVVETGSAKSIEGAEFVKLLNSDKHELKCLVTARKDYSILVNPKLDVYPCCSQCVENTILNMGNLKEASLSEIIEDIKCNKVIHTIFTKGFTPFIQFMKENDILYPKELTSHCEMCEYLFSSDWFLKYLEQEKYYENI